MIYDSITTELRHSREKSCIKGHIKEYFPNHSGRFKFEFSHFMTNVYQVQPNTQGWYEILQLIDQGVLVENGINILHKEFLEYHPNGTIKHTKYSRVPDSILAPGEYEVHYALGVCPYKNGEVVYHLNRKLQRWFQQLTEGQRAILHFLDTVFRGGNTFIVVRNLHTKQWQICNKQTNEEIIVALPLSQQQKDVQFLLGQKVLVRLRSSRKGRTEFGLSKQYKNLKFLEDKQVINHSKRWLNNKSWSSNEVYN